MSYKVRAAEDNAFELLALRGRLFEDTTIEGMERILAEILVSEKGYPDDTVVTINGDDMMDMALVVYNDGSWELV